MANQIMHRMSATLCQSKACRGSVLMLRFGAVLPALIGVLVLSRPFAPRNLRGVASPSPAAKPAPKSQASAVDGHWSLSSGWATMGVLYPGYTHPGQLWCPTAGVACDRHTGAAAAWTIPESKAGQAR
jgi:hypothetical protein